MRLSIKARLRFGNRLQLRNNAVFVVIKTDAEVYFVTTWIVFKTLHQGENGIASVGVNFLKHVMFLQVYMRQVITQ
ncbi:Uncharacterised protein [Klebsiella pneumoniae]|nr:Uncharacterised protein [Klebsiella pneumoniae]